MSGSRAEMEVLSELILCVSSFHLYFIRISSFPLPSDMSVCENFNLILINKICETTMLLLSRFSDHKSWIFSIKFYNFHRKYPRFKYPIINENFSYIELPFTYVLYVLARGILRCRSEWKKKVFRGA